jgi:hypothetical protein
MANNPLIKQVFGNHDMMRQYLNYLNDPEELPPFLPVLFRSVGHANDDIESIRENERLQHNALNRRLSRELINQFAVYQQLQIEPSAE